MQHLESGAPPETGEFGGAQLSALGSQGSGNDENKTQTGMTWDLTVNPKEM